ncbi:hypothetical protein LLE79_10835, partial [Staphylococcus epidermidis]
MKVTQLTYILLIIASILLIANGIFAFERTLSMILMSILFILVGIILLSTTLNTMYQSSKHSKRKISPVKRKKIFLNIK